MCIMNILNDYTTPTQSRLNFCHLLLNMYTALYTCVCDFGTTHWTLIVNKGYVKNVTCDVLETASVLIRQKLLVDNF